MANAPRLRPRHLAVVALFVGPTWLLYLARWAQQPETFSGFLLWELPYYAANARQIFDGGHLFCHENPYAAPDPAPAIFCNPMTWVQGLLGSALGPTAAWLLVGAVAGVAMAVVTVRLVLSREPAARALHVLVAAWGGGLFVVAALATGTAFQSPPVKGLFALDPAEGMWMLNWGRNLVYPTEATYHALMAALYLGVLQRRFRLALLALAAILAIHPWTAADALAIVGIWGGLLLLRRELSTVPTFFWLGVAALGGAFVAYHFLWLPSHPSYRAIQETWALDWRMDAHHFPLAYGLVAIPALAQLRREGRALGYGSLFLLCCVLGPLLLTNHGLLIRPRQPIHFAHGYIWFGLFLLGLPTLVRWGSEATRPGRLALWAVLALSLVDNATFFVARASSEDRSDGIPLEVRALYAELARTDLRGVAVAPSGRLMFEMATWTAVDPYLGHWALTPRYQLRRQQVAALYREGAAGEWFDAVNVVVARPGQVPPPARSWPAHITSPAWTVRVRPAADGTR